MKTLVSTYLNDVAEKYKTGTSTEHTYRREMEELLRGVFETIGVKRITNEAKTEDKNKPDFVIFNNQIPLLYIETKDIGISLDKVEKSEQMNRYFGYANLILTDYLEFRFYRNGLPYGEPIKIANFNKKEKTLTYHDNTFERLTRRLIDFTKSHKEPIRSGSHLAKIMGGKSQRIRDNIREFLIKDPEKTNETIKVYETIKKLLVHDLDIESFSDMYAQTVVYGLFVARYYDETPDDFSRQEARDLIPNSNPFLRNFFDHIVGPNFDKRLEFIVNELCQVFSHSDIEKLMSDFYKRSSKSKTTHDPIIHFYEDFLKEYDSDLRKRMGAYYTPTPVVRFMTRSVDHLLKKEFKLKKGLADTAKLDDGKTHKVQILDPAVGTGTFISGIIREIFKKFKGQEGRWPKYVHNDLLPRIHGFELMMAPYTIAHLKLGMAFKETGFKYFNNRLGIYLTNSLENDTDQKNLFSAFGLADSIANESKEAQKIKNDKPIMIVIGNPPYSVSSQNKGKWIQDQIQVYKKDLNERNIQPLSDDYIKFLRFAEQFVEKNKSGIVAMITNNSFIDGIIHRQMRKHLLETFDDIYILDLHGNSKKKETAPDGSKDENVFNIMQGVSINIFVKNNGESETLGRVHHAELFGKRKKKFDFLNKNNIESVKWDNLKYIEPHYFFVPKDFSLIKEYEKGFKIDDLFVKSKAGSATGKDSLYTKMSNKELIESLEENQIDFQKESIRDYLYRPFDTRKIIYDNSLIQRLRKDIMDNFLEDNIALLTCKQQTSFDFQHVFITNLVSDRCSVSLQTGEVGYVFPLFIYSNNGIKKTNFNSKVTDKIQDYIGDYTPEELFDYIYAILHSPTYRKRYKEFLKIDFPRIPYPTNRNLFNKLVKMGAELRNYHLIKSDKLDDFVTTYPEMGSNIVEQVKYKDNNLWINDKQYFGNIPVAAWEFFIGGYQPAQKWIKDRKKINRTLTDRDIEHYQRIIVALLKTDKIMEKIDKLVPKWPI